LWLLWFLHDRDYRARSRCWFYDGAFFFVFVVGFRHGLGGSLRLARIGCYCSRTTSGFLLRTRGGRRQRRLILGVCGIFQDGFVIFVRFGNRAVNVIVSRDGGRKGWSSTRRTTAGFDVCVGTGGFP